jgi:nucleotide-binding universal stress UspA family protein
MKMLAHDTGAALFCKLVQIDCLILRTQPESYAGQSSSGLMSVKARRAGTRELSQPLRRSDASSRTAAHAVEWSEMQPRKVEEGMYKHILIATDGSELAGKAVTDGLALAKSLQAKATVVTVTESWDAFEMAKQIEQRVENPVALYEKNAAAWADKILSAVRRTANQQGVTCETLHMSDRYPAEGILEAAKSSGCDLIVMSSHGRRGVAKLLLGSQAINVLTHSAVPVLICR